MLKANLEVSEIGLGGEYFIDQPVEVVEAAIDHAIEAGINILDVFMPQPEVRSSIGLALKGKREKMIIQGHLCTTTINGQYERTREIEKVKESFEDLLKRLQTDYIDIGMIHYVDSEEDYDKVFDTEIMTYAKELKEKGVIKAIGLSSHNPHIAQKAIETGLIDVLMFSINPAYDLENADTEVYELIDFKGMNQEKWQSDGARMKLYNTCEAKGIGITVMKALGAGRLLSDADSPFGKALTVVQCCNYALNRPGVASIMVGCKSKEEVAEAVRYTTATEKEKSYHTISWNSKFSFTGKCMYCNHCQPCPMGIDIAAVTKFTDIATMHDTVPETVQNHYDNLKSKASICQQCGLCEMNCPFRVKIRANMRKAAEIFERK